jgi:PAS domain S-box-containing protein
MAFTNEDTLNILKILLGRENNYISVVDTEGKYLYKNPPLIKLLNDESADSTSFLNAVHSEDKEKIINIFKELINSGKEQSTEYRLVDCSGNIHNVRSWCGILSSKENHSEKIILITNDATLEATQKEEIAKLKIIVEQSSDQIVVTNKEGIIEYVNPEFEKITGYTKEESVGKTIRKLISGKNDQKFYDEVWGKIAGGQSFHGEVINKTKTGEYFSCDKKITPMKDKDGNITHFVSTSKTLKLEN